MSPPAGAGRGFPNNNKNKEGKTKMTHETKKRVKKKDDAKAFLKDLGVAA